ncbi:MAG: zinc ribbon domain-containing protein [Planctomycetota bacterium]
MPIYEYAIKEGDPLLEPCENCRSRFEVFQKITDAALTECPECGAPIERLLSLPAKKTIDRQSNTHLKELGFSKYMRNCDGQMEKRFGPPLSSYD